MAQISTQDRTVDLPMNQTWSDGHRNAPRFLHRSVFVFLVLSIFLRIPPTSSLESFSPLLSSETSTTPLAKSWSDSLVSRAVQAIARFSLPRAVQATPAKCLERFRTPLRSAGSERKKRENGARPSHSSTAAVQTPFRPLAMTPPPESCVFSLSNPNSSSSSTCSSTTTSIILSSKSSYSNS